VSAEWPDKVLLTTKETAAILGVHVVTVWRLVRSGKLVSMKMGHRSVRIATDELKRYVEEASK
jgi:excisionase family DNA binding protein